MADEVRVEFDIDRQLVEDALEAALLAEDGARILEEEIKALIPDVEGPSLPGHPPHSPGPLRDSFHSTRARRRGDQVIAWTFSLAEASNGESLPLLLDRGGRAVPRPFLDEAEIRAQRRLEAQADE